MNPKNTQLNRRNFLGGFGALGLGASLTSICSADPFMNYKGLKNLGPLNAPDSLGIRLPDGFTSKKVAESGYKVRRANGEKTNYRWHGAPDGGACFPTDDGGWIYTSNAELNGNGGAGALRFSSNGELIDAYPILENTDRNCAGGLTPWGSWLSCEEVDRGRVFECDIYGRGAQLCKGLGYFKHEAVAIDPVDQQAYLTEDEKDGLFYRFTPNTISSGVMNFDEGLLEAAELDSNGNVTWHEVPNPTPELRDRATRHQVDEASIFDGGEGIWYHQGQVFFTTKGDNRVWRYDIHSRTLGITYDKKTSKNGILSGVDNVTVSSDGHVLVAEDGGDMQIVILGPFGDIYPLLQIVDQDHSEITGPAITSNNKHLYFSSQRGGRKGEGITYQINGSF